MSGEDNASQPWRKEIKYLASLIASLILTNAPVAMAASGAKYTVTFNGTWSAQTHPTEYPSGAHFSGLIGATHNGGYSVFADGATATAGLENLAENGRHHPLDDEIRAAVAAGKAGALLESDPIFGPPGTASISFAVDEKFPTVSLVAMIAPSPDWFTGTSVDLRENGAWVDRKKVVLYAWDAGTDTGTTYRAPDADAMPRMTAVMNDSPHFKPAAERIPVGTLVFVRQ